MTTIKNLNVITNGGYRLQVRKYLSSSNEWQTETDFLERASQRTLFNSLSYAEVVSCSLNIEAFVLSLFDLNETICGCLTLYRLPILPYGKKLSNMAFTGSYGAAVCSDEESKAEFLNGLEKFQELIKPVMIEMRVAEGVLLNEQKCDHVYGNYSLELKVAPKEIWESAVNQKARNQVRKARKSGLAFSIHKEDGLSHFYAIYKQTMKGLGSPALPFLFFATLAKKFPDNFFISLVSHDGMPISALFNVKDSEHVHNVWAGALFEYRNLCPNYLNYWSVIEWCCLRGYNRFDFGRSILGSPQEHFKKQWGAELTQLTYVDLRSGEHANTIDPNSAIVAALSSIWRRLPMFAMRPLNLIFSRFTG